MKRILVLILSIATIICFGYSLGALGVTVLRSPQWGRVFLWLFLGIVCSTLAIKFWQDYTRELEAENKNAK